MITHHNKHIREAIEYAISREWRVVKSSGSAHAWGKLYCPESSRNGCIIVVYGTPRVPENHADRIRKLVDACRHG